MHVSRKVIRPSGPTKREPRDGLGSYVGHRVIDAWRFSSRNAWPSYERCCGKFAYCPLCNCFSFSIFLLPNGSSLEVCFCVLLMSIVMRWTRPCYLPFEGDHRWPLWFFDHRTHRRHWLRLPVRGLIGCFLYIFEHTLRNMFCFTCIPHFFTFVTRSWVQKILWCLTTWMATWMCLYFFLEAVAIPHSCPLLFSFVFFKPSTTPVFSISETSEKNKSSNKPCKSSKNAAGILEFPCESEASTPCSVDQMERGLQCGSTLGIGSPSHCPCVAVLGHYRLAIIWPSKNNAQEVLWLARLEKGLLRPGGVTWLSWNWTRHSVKTETDLDS